MKERHASAVPGDLTVLVRPSFRSATIVSITALKAEFVIRLYPDTATQLPSRVSYRAVFRAPEEGGTWWQSWEESLADPSLDALAQLLAHTVGQRRRDFPRMLADATQAA